MKTYNVARKKENMWALHGYVRPMGPPYPNYCARYRDFYVYADHQDIWYSDKRWVCDGYIIERRFFDEPPWFKNRDGYTVYTKWYWEKLAPKEKEKVLQNLDEYILGNHPCYSRYGSKRYKLAVGQFIHIKEILEKTGRVMKYDSIKKIPTLYGAVEIIETLESPYKRKQLKQIVYYKPKKWVQALLGI